MRDFVQSKINAQSAFILQYLRAHPEEYSKYLDEIDDNSIQNYFVKNINSQFSKMLVISYCFSPYIDTSGVVMSKRIRDFGAPVDVIYNRMDKVRKTDDMLNTIASPFVGKAIELNAPQAFSNWPAIEKFCEHVERAYSEMGKNKKYEKIYSRAMWPASHFAAAVLKKNNPSLYWIAEFSDPLLRDTLGKNRSVEIALSWLEKNEFSRLIKSNEHIQNLFYWCEMLPYLLADELIFTNKNQLEYMISYLENREIENDIRRKAKIIPQPTLPDRFYKISEKLCSLDRNVVNVAYFGSFYANRGIGSFMDAWDTIEDRAGLNLHVFTQQNKDDVISGVPEKLKGFVHVNEYVGYFDFLKLSNDFDALLVMDCETQGVKPMNPYLPSKLSDYLGSDSNIFALVEQSSPMDLQLDTSARIYKARMNSDVHNVCQELNRLVDAVKGKNEVLLEAVV